MKKLPLLLAFLAITSFAFLAPPSPAYADTSACYATCTGYGSETSTADSGVSLQSACNTGCSASDCDTACAYPTAPDAAAICLGACANPNSASSAAADAAAAAADAATAADAAADAATAASASQTTVTLFNPLGSLTDPRKVIGSIIAGIISLVGSVTLLMFVYGGVLWITAMGDPKKVQKGKDILLWGIMGLILIAGSYTLVNAIISGLTTGNAAK